MKTCNIKVGDKVRVVCEKPSDANDISSPPWFNCMDCLLGREGIVEKVDPQTSENIWILVGNIPGEICQSFFKPEWLISATAPAISWAEEEAILKKKRDDVFRYMFEME
jgi:hypothetical protein